MAGKDENGVKGFQMRKPLNRTKWESFRKAIYDSSTGQFLGRTGKSWGQLLLFYTIFYIILAAMFAICMQGLLATLDEREPSRKLDDSLIGTNPGLGFRPISEKTEEGSLIWYNVTNTTTGEKWINLLHQFLEPYKASQTGANFHSCNSDNGPGSDGVCTVKMDDFQDCSPDQNFGYSTPSPCVFIKINKIYGWIPEYYTKPINEMPEDLRDYITEKNYTKGLVWISCQGARPVDREHARNFTYYPQRGFAPYYFPYTNAPNYLSPIVAVQVINPTPNVIISIECRAWAKNIEYNPSDRERQGAVKFELLVD